MEFPIVCLDPSYHVVVAVIIKKYIEENVKGFSIGKTIPYVAKCGPLKFCSQSNFSNFYEGYRKIQQHPKHQTSFTKSTMIYLLIVHYLVLQILIYFYNTY